MKLSIIIPCYNEKKTIRECLARVSAADLGSVEREIIIVDDGSTDGSRKILEAITPGNGVKIFFHPENRGKGAAIITALPNVTGDFVTVQDADLEYDPSDYRILLDELVNKNAKVVYGSRRLHKGNKWSYLSFSLGGIFLSFLTNLLYGSNITDEPTCYKMFRSEIIKGMNLTSPGFEICPEITAELLKGGITIHEVPISYNPRHVAEGKKIKWTDGLLAIWILFKHRFKK